MRKSAGRRLYNLPTYLKFSCAPKTQHGGDSITEIDAELRWVIDVSMGVYETGNDRLAVGIHFLHTGWKLDMCANAFDAAAADKQGRVFNCGATGAVADASAHPGLACIGFIVWISFLFGGLRWASGERN